MKRITMTSVAGAIAIALAERLLEPGQLSHYRIEETGSLFQRRAAIGRAAFLAE